jgi:uncharacterized LabA/DUF88 family protein
MISQQVHKANQPLSDSEQGRQVFFAPGRHAIMIDGNSIHYALRALNTNLDYRKLRELFGTKRNLVCANYYALTASDDEFSSSRPLLDWLDYNGYTVREKMVWEKTHSNGDRSPKKRVSLDMAVDALEMAPLLDHLFLFSGDGDLAAMVEAVQRKGVQVTAVSTLTTRPSMIANELRRQVDRFIDLSELIPLVGRTG